MENMTLDEFIIEMILHGLKQNQLICGLDRYNLDVGYCHYMRVLDLIKKLMEILENLMVEFLIIYMAAMHKSVKFPIFLSGDELMRLGMGCYENFLKE